MVWQRYHMISSAYTDVQRILEPHWTKRTPGHTQTKNGSLTFYFPLMNISTQENLRYHLIPSRGADDEKILQSNWVRDTTSHTKLYLVVSDATFLWWLSLCNSSLVSIDSFQSYWWSKTTSIWLDRRHN